MVVCLHFVLVTYWKRAHQLIDFTDYQDLFDKYETLQKISFDYAVVEHEEKIEVMRFFWNVEGSWNLEYTYRGNG